MTKSGIKKKLLELINSIDDVEILKAIFIILKSNERINTVAEPQTEYLKKKKSLVPFTPTKKKSSATEDYTKPGKPMSQAAFTKRIEEAEERINKGEFVTQKELEKEMEKW